MELQCEWTDVAALARGVAADFEPLFAHRRVALAIEHDNRPYWVEADPQRLVQVLANVFDNALKFTPAGGAVKLTVSKRDGTIHLCVRDNGKGIAPDRLPLLLHARMDLRRACGLGLGLAVSRRILERHGGTLAISSSGIGHGTAVLIRLPALDDRPAPTRPVGSAP
jgi:signal transduction histidine kinase